MKAPLIVSLALLAALAGPLGCGTTEVAPTIVSAPAPKQKSVINATKAAALVKLAVGKSTGQKIAFSRCPSNVIASKGATIACTVAAASGAEATVTLTMQPSGRLKITKFLPRQPPQGSPPAP